MPDEEKKQYPSIHQDLMLRLILKKQKTKSVVETGSAGTRNSTNETEEPVKEEKKKRRMKT